MIGPRPIRPEGTLWAVVDYEGNVLGVFRREDAADVECQRLMAGSYWLAGKLRTCEVKIKEVESAW